MVENCTALVSTSTWFPSKFGIGTSVVVSKLNSNQFNQTVYSINKIVHNLSQNFSLLSNRFFFYFVSTFFF